MAQNTLRQMESSFTFKASARPVQDRARYREEMEPTKQYCNIVVDPRIYRGSTWARRSILQEQIQPIPAYPRRVVQRSPDADFDALHRDGFSEALVQTDDFDGNVIIVKHEESVGIQTDPYVEKPIVHRKPPPMRAVGVKVSLPGTALFDFDVAVRPITTTLCQKAMTQAMMEVAEELELEQMQTYLKAFEHKAKVDSQAIARIEQAEQKRFEEKERIVQERLREEARQDELRRKIMARGDAEWLVWDIQDDVMKMLEKSGYFYDETEREIEEKFLPWLTEQANAALAKPSLVKALAARAAEEADEVCVRDCNEVVIDEQIVADRKESTELVNLRRMIGEDKVAVALRLHKEYLKNRPPPAEEEEEEEKDEEEGRKQEASSLELGEDY